MNTRLWGPHSSRGRCNMRMSRSVLLAVAATLQVACGGGGGGDSSNNNGGGNNPPPASGDSITTNNGMAVATDVVTSTQFVKDLGLPDAAGPFIPTQVTVR